MSFDSPIAMNWDCESQGCFNRKKRLKFAVFKDVLPGKISFSDVDGLVEINGNLLFMEWKDHPQISTSHRILFERLTRFSPATVLIVEGDAESMSVSSVRTVREGRIGPEQTADIDSLRAMIKQWADWAQGNPVTLQPAEAV